MDRYLAEQARQGAEGTCTNLGWLMIELQTRADATTQRIQGLEATLKASRKVAEERAVEVDGMYSSIVCHFISYSPAMFKSHREPLYLA